MKVALTVWENRISPVFDSAHMLLIVDIGKAGVKEKVHEFMNPEYPHKVAERLSDLGVGVLICGAISEIPAKVIENTGINLIPFITGSWTEVLESYVKSMSVSQSFLMPGCGRGRRRSCRGRKNIMPGKGRQFRSQGKN